ncbi:hypothetical protein D3C80_1820520 [compost metagenome]
MCKNCTNCKDDTSVSSNVEPADTVSEPIQISPETLEKLQEYIVLHRRLHANDDYLEDHSIGVNQGVNDTLDDIEEILSSILKPSK